MSELAVVSADDLSALLPAQREAAVTQYLTDARDRLAVALQATGPEAVAALKAEIATAAEATKQLGLSKEIQQDAQEMVRRAEYALGKAIRAGQERGEISRKGDNGVGFTPGEKASATTFGTPGEIYGSSAEKPGVLQLVDEVTDSEFEAAISGARAEGNLSRANVVRKIKEVTQDVLTPVEKLVKLRELASTGMTSGAIAKELGVTEGYVRDRARENRIKVIGDETTRGTRRLNADRVIESTVLDASNVVSPSLIEAINFADLNRELLGEWISSLSESIKALRSLKSSLEKELDRG